MEVDPGLKQGYVDQEVGHETEMHTEIKKKLFTLCYKTPIIFLFLQMRQRGKPGCRKLP